MKCSVIHIGNDRFATDYYKNDARSKLKRDLMGIDNEYDIVNIDRVVDIVQKSDEVTIYGMSNTIRKNEFVFSSLFDRGVDDSKILIGDYSNIEVNRDRNYTMKEYEIIELLYNSNMDKLRKINTLGMSIYKSIYNLYWVKGEVKEWENIEHKLKAEYDIIAEALNKKYGIDVNRYVTDSRHKLDIKELSNKENNELEKAYYSYTDSIIKFNEKHGLFKVYRGKCKIVNVNKDRYYRIRLNGLQYMYRLYKQSINFEGLFDIRGVENFESLKVLRYFLSFCMHYGDKMNTAIKKGFDGGRDAIELLSILIGDILKINSKIFIYEIKPDSIEFAVDKNLEFNSIAESIKGIINRENITSAFDSITKDDFRGLSLDDIAYGIGDESIKI